MSTATIDPWPREVLRHHICQKKLRALTIYAKETYITTKTNCRQNNMNAVKCTNTYAICVNLINIYTPCLKVAQILPQRVQILGKICCNM